MTRLGAEDGAGPGAGAVLDDPEQLRRFRDGNEQVLARVYQAYVQSVARFLRAGFQMRTKAGLARFPGLRSACDLEVGVHEVFTRAFGKTGRRSYDGVRPYAGYLIGIARNYCIDLSRLWRVESRRRLAAIQQAALAPTSVEPHLGVSDTEVVVNEFVAALDPFERQVFELRLKNGEPQEHVAATLDCHRMRVRRTEKRLRELLQRQLVEAGCMGGDGCQRPCEQEGR